MAPRERTELKVAQQLVDDDDARAAVDPAQEALSAFRSKGDKAGVAEATRLLMLGRSAAGEAKAALDLGKQTLETMEAAEDKAVVQLGLAEVGVAGGATAQQALKWSRFAQGVFAQMKWGAMEGQASLAAAGAHLAANDKQAAHEARSAADQALILFQAAGDIRGQALAHHCLAAAHAVKGEFEAAVRSGKEAVASWQKASLRKAEASEHVAVANWLLEDGEPERASEAAEEALSICEELYIFADPREAGFLQTLVKSHLQAKNLEKALRVARDGLERMQDSGNHGSAGSAFETMSMAQAGQGLLAKAIRSATKAAYAFEDASDSKGQASAMRTVSTLHCRLGNWGKALRTAQESLSIWEELDDLSEQALTLQLRGDVFLGRGEARSAVRCMTEARELFQDAKDVRGEAEALLKLSAAELADDEPTKAQRAAEESQALAAQSDDAAGQAAALRAIADIHSRGDEHDAALKVGQRALAIYRELGDQREAEAATLMHMSSAQLSDIVKKDKAGKATDKSFKDATDKALKYAKEALAIAKRTGNQQLTGACLYTVAQSHTMCVRAPEALKVADEGLKACRQCGDLRGEAGLLVLLGNINFLLIQDINMAREKAEEAVFIYQQVGDAAGEEGAWALVDRIEEKVEEERKKRQEAQARQMQMQQMAMGQQMPQGGTMISAAQEGEGPPAAAGAAPVAADFGSIAKLDVGSGLTAEMVEKQILEVAKAIVGTDEPIDVDMPLMEAGLTSNTAVVLRDQLLAALPGVKLPVTLTFDYPSVSAMGELILENAAKGKK